MDRVFKKPHQETNNSMPNIFYLVQTSPICNIRVRHHAACAILASPFWRVKAVMFLELSYQPQHNKQSIYTLFTLCVCIFEFLFYHVPEVCGSVCQVPSYCLCLPVVACMLDSLSHKLVWLKSTKVSHLVVVFSVGWWLDVLGCSWWGGENRLFFSFYNFCKRRTMMTRGKNGSNNIH